MSERYDERHNVQSRGVLERGTSDYADFYRMHPEWQANREDLIEGPVAPQRADISAVRATEKVKGYAQHLGADLVRVDPLIPSPPPSWFEEPDPVWRKYRRLT